MRYTLTWSSGFSRHLRSSSRSTCASVNSSFVENGDEEGPRQNEQRTYEGHVEARGNKRPTEAIQPDHKRHHRDQHRRPLGGETLCRVSASIGADYENSDKTDESPEYQREALSDGNQT